MRGKTIITCENMCKSISAGYFQGRVLGTKHIQEKSSQTAEDSQETKASDYSQQQDGLRVHAVI